MIIRHDPRRRRHAGVPFHRRPPRRAVLRQIRRTAQRILPVCRHDPVPRGTPVILVPLHARKLAQHPVLALPALARRIWPWVAMHLQMPIRETHRQHPQPQSPAELDIRGQRLGRTRPRHADIDDVRHRQPRHRLVQERQRKPRLQLDNHRIRAVAQRHHIRCPDLALHVVALPLKERLHRGIKLCLAHTAIPCQAALQRKPHPRRYAA